MKPIDVHPEHLIERLDRDRGDELTPSERSHLDHHLRECAACRLEIRVRADFEAASRAPTAPDVRATVARVPMPGGEPPRGARPRRASVTLRTALLATALLALSGLAAAASEWGRGLVARWSASTPALVGKAPTAPREARPSVLEVPAQVAAGPIGATTAGSAAGPPPAPSSPAPSSAAARPPAPRFSAAPAVRSTTRASFAVDESSEALFRDANTARRRGDSAAAAALYRTLIRRHPGSLEAHESVEVLGRLLLDDGATSEALDCFDTYVHGGGELAPEAMVGRALALRRLGLAKEEQAAWRTLLGAYPASLYADRARARLAALER